MLNIVINFIQEHKTTIIGLIGSGMTIVSKYLVSLGIVGQVFAGVGGIILIMLAIAIKIVEFKTKLNALKKLNKSRGKK